MSELPSDLVTYNKPVRCVNWNNSEQRENSVIVECDDGERITADHVIVTVPLGMHSYTKTVNCCLPQCLKCTITQLLTVRTQILIVLTLLYSVIELFLYSNL